MSCFGMLFSLPTDILPFLFSFLSPKELCCLDSAILNHTDRPLFLSALIQRFTNTDSEFFGFSFGGDSLVLKFRWYLCRNIPITNLSLHYIDACPEGMISLNSKSLKEITFFEATLDEEDVLALAQCSNLKKFELYRCSLPPNFHVASILQNLTTLEDLDLENVSFSRPTAEIISQHCRSLKFLQFSNLDGVGDDELRVLVEGCPSLCSLSLSYLDNITEESVSMLRNHRPRIPSIGIRYCERVRLESVMSLLREIAIPTIFHNDDDEELQISALKNLSFSIGYTSTEDSLSIENFLTQETLLQRLGSLLASRIRIWSDVFPFFRSVAENGYHSVMVDAAVIPTLIDFFNLFDISGRSKLFQLLELLTSKTNCHCHLLSSGILSIFRPHLLNVRAFSFRICLPSLLLSLLFMP
jgi:hypothetical protein